MARTSERRASSFAELCEYACKETGASTKGGLERKGMAYPSFKTWIVQGSAKICCHSCQNLCSLAPTAEWRTKGSFLLWGRRGSRRGFAFSSGPAKNTFRGSSFILSIRESGGRNTAHRSGRKHRSLRFLGRLRQKILG